MCTIMYVYNCVCVQLGVCIIGCVYKCVYLQIRVFTFNATTVSQANKASEKSNAKVDKDKVKVEKKEEVEVKVDEVAKEEEVKVKVQDEVEDEVVAEDHDAVKLAANGAKVLFQV